MGGWIVGMDKNWNDLDKDNSTTKVVLLCGANTIKVDFGRITKAIVHNSL